MDDASSDVSAAYRIEHHTPQGATVVRHLIEPDRRAGTGRISRVFQEILPGFQARSEPGRLDGIGAVARSGGSGSGGGETRG